MPRVPLILHDLTPEQGTRQSCEPNLQKYLPFRAPNESEVHSVSSVNATFSLTTGEFYCCPRTLRTVGCGDQEFRVSKSELQMGMPRLEFLLDHVLAWQP